MGKALGYVEDISVFRREIKALPLAKGFGVLPKVYRYVKNRAAEDLDQLVLATPALEVEAAEYAFFGAGAQLLPRKQLYAVGGKDGLFKGLGKPPPAVQGKKWPQHRQPRNGGL